MWGLDNWASIVPIFTMLFLTSMKYNLQQTDMIPFMDSVHPISWTLWYMRLCIRFDVNQILWSFRAYVFKMGWNQGFQSFPKSLLIIGHLQLLIITDNWIIIENYMRNVFKEGIWPLSYCRPKYSTKVTHIQALTCLIFVQAIQYGWLYWTKKGQILQVNQIVN